MKVLYQFGIIIAISFLGEVLHAILPLPVPASIYGLLLMLFVLGTGIVKLEQVKDAGKFLLDIMPPMFIPAGVGLMTAWYALKTMFVPAVIITVATTVIVMVVTGKVAQKVIRHRKKEEKK